MFSFFKNIFSTHKKSRVDARQEEMLKSGDPVKLRQLAESTDTHPEILYYLAKTGDDAVRRAVATNRATPVQASTLLANDKSVDVRVALVARLVELLPDLSPDRQSQLYAYAVQALGLLAQDEVFKIRRALSTTLQDYAKAPPAVVARLARDVEREISEPILRFCVALPDDDMIEILKGHPEAWVISTIASRDQVSEGLSAAVVDTGDAVATGVLLGNVGAKFSQKTLQNIIERAREHPEWHQPIALRSELSLELARQLSGFVSAVVLEVLEKRSDFDAATRQGLMEIIKRRLDYQNKSAPNEPAAEKVARFVEAGKLTAEVILDALSWQEKDFVILSLSYLSNIPPDTVRKMLSAGSAKPVVALCWNAKLPMRFCIELQKSGARLQPKDILYAKGGTDYPMNEDDIKWQLEFYGIK